MIAISSLRPLDECDDEIAFNQFDACASWEPVFSKVIYFGSEEPELKGDNIEFIEAQDFPLIREMAIEASQQTEPACLINADIQVASGLEPLSNLAFRRGFNCLISRRYEIPPGSGFEAARIVDNGLDFFAATPEIWAAAAREVPLIFRIGHQVWDTWMLGFFTNYPQCRCGDLTPGRVIFHPRHGGRKHPHLIEPPPGDKYLAKVRWPKDKIGV